MLRRSLLVVTLLWVAILTWNAVKPLPQGVHFEGASVGAGDVAFLHDLTYRDDAGQQVVEQQIFDELFALVDGARSFVLLDLFLFNDHAGKAGEVHRPLSAELRDALLESRRRNPELQVIFITDPINDVYGGDPSAVLAELRQAGVEVVLTDLERLRDSNPLYSALWRLVFRWLGNSHRGGWLPHVFRQQGPPLTLRTYLRLLNFKANHRKVVVADDGSGGLVALVTSANPHDASSAHSNVGVRIAGTPARQVLASELDVARFSGWSGELPLPPPAAGGNGPISARFVTEGAIRSSLLDSLAAAGDGDRVDMAMFYLSERGVVRGLLAAAERGAQVRLVLDPNRDAFGREKDGVPNRPVANELVRRSGGRIAVRWYETHGEQFHTKMTVVRTAGKVIASLGSANLTRRNVGDLNLEANLELEAPRDSALDSELERYFETLWHNRDGNLYSVDFESYRDTSSLRYWRYRVMEATGLSTF